MGFKEMEREDYIKRYSDIVSQIIDKYIPDKKFVYTTYYYTYEYSKAIYGYRDNKIHTSAIKEAIMCEFCRVKDLNDIKSVLWKLIETLRRFEKKNDNFGLPWLKYFIEVNHASNSTILYSNCTFEPDFHKDLIYIFDEYGRLIASQKYLAVNHLGFAYESFAKIVKEFIDTMILKKEVI